MSKSKYVLLNYRIGKIKYLRYACTGLIAALMISVAVHAQIPGTAYTIFQPTDVPEEPLLNDENGFGLEVGLKFKSSQNGNIYGIRFYKGAGANNGQVGNIWTTGGSLLATVEFTSQTASGWQEVLLAEPLAITANTTYVVSYFSPSGDFATTELYFDNDPKITNDLEAPMHGGADGYNGVYKYTNSSVFPDQGSNAANYFVDIIFDTGTGDDKTNYVAKYISPTTISKSIIFDNGSSIGIGTTTMSGDYKLFVDQGIKTKKVKVEATGWADYVFDNDYKLATLKEVEDFIKINKHLPGVPSAKEVEKDGLNLGDNQAVLLKKIEELTLYLLEQDKEKEQMKARIRELEEKFQAIISGKK